MSITIEQKNRVESNKKIMKYKLTKNKTTIGDVTLYQIEALKDFSNIKKGDLGGWIEKESNLSQQGNCWVYGDALVYDDALVYGDAEVYGSTLVFGNTVVSGNTKVYSTAEIYGDDWAYGIAKVYDDARVFGGARIYGDSIDLYGELTKFKINNHEI
jgi:hypothetical protein